MRELSKTDSTIDEFVRIEKAYDGIRELFPKILKAYDAMVLRGYNPGKEFRFLIYENDKYTRTYDKLLTELRAVALRKVIPTLPLERANKTEMHLYVLRDLFYSLVKGSAALFLLHEDGHAGLEDCFHRNYNVLSEILVVMARLIDHANENRTE